MKKFLWIAFLWASAASAQGPLSPIGADNTGFRPIGAPIPVEATDFTNPVYLKIRLTVGELEGVESVAIFDRTAHREVFRFRRSDWQGRTQGQSADVRVVFGKNLTFRRLDRQPHRQIMVTMFNDRGRPVRSSAFEFDAEPHPAELMTADVSYQTFYDVAQINFHDACHKMGQLRSAISEILIGEAEQTFPSFERLSEIQTRESLRGYFEGCIAAYQACGGKERDAQGFCASERDKLRQEAF